MTNAEKYKEVFGFKPDKGACPAETCDTCPGHVEQFLCSCNFWEDEYKEPNHETN